MPTTQPDPRRLNRAELAALAVAVPIATLLYALHWYPGPGGRIWYGDSVSFQYYAISHSLGHPPGYPQYLALIRAVARLPLGHAWQRVNFVSSLFGALALAAYYLLGRSLRLGILQACAAVLTLGLSKTAYQQATEAEVYTLNLFWTLTSAWLYVRYLDTRRYRDLLLFFVAYGCSLGHHPTVVWLALPVTLVTVLHDRRLFVDWRAYAAAALAIVIGLAQYAYTYKLFTDSSLTFRFVDYPERSLSNFIDFTTGAGFKSAMFSQSFGAMWRDKVPTLLAVAHAQNTIVFPLCGLVWISSSRVPPAHRIWLLTCIAAFSTWALGYDVHDIDAFCTPLWAFCYLGVAPGLQMLVLRSFPGTACAVVLALSLIAFRISVVETGNYRPTNDLLAMADEYIGHLPAGATLVPFKVGGNSAFPSLLRYLAASGDSGSFRVANTVKRCITGLYFTEASRTLLRVRHFDERQVAFLERSQQPLFVMECKPASARQSEGAAQP